MKHLLIILSILLLSSPVIGDNHKGETLYAWDISSTRSPEYVWRGFGEEETHPKYIGDVKNGKPNGLGIFIHPYGYKYVGEWKDGKKQGQGTDTLPDNKKIFVDGWKYVGGWKDGERNGQGTFTWSSGDKYVGEWKNGEKNGQGTETLPDGRKYVGKWKEGRYDGQGTQTLSKGTKFVGEWKDNNPWNVTLYDKDGNILGKFVKGKVKEQ